MYIAFLAGQMSQQLAHMATVWQEGLKRDHWQVTWPHMGSPDTECLCCLPGERELIRMAIL
jgi:hypothetical protein